MFTINYIRGILFVTFDSLIVNGEIEVADDKGKIRVQKAFSDSNFERIKLERLSGRITVTIRYDHMQTKKTIYI